MKFFAVFIVYICMSDLDFIIYHLLEKSEELGLASEQALDYVYFILEDIYGIELD